MTSGQSSTDPEMLPASPEANRASDPWRALRRRQGIPGLIRVNDPEGFATTLVGELTRVNVVNRHPGTKRAVMRPFVRYQRPKAPRLIPLHATEFFSRPKKAALPLAGEVGLSTEFDSPPRFQPSLGRRPRLDPLLIYPAPPSELENSDIHYTVRKIFS